MRKTLSPARTRPSTAAWPALSGPVAVAATLGRDAGGGGWAPKAGTGGVDVSADGGAIVATRCAYEGSGIVKQMSEEKIVSQLRKDVAAAFG